MSVQRENLSLLQVCVTVIMVECIDEVIDSYVMEVYL